MLSEANIRRLPERSEHPQAASSSTKAHQCINPVESTLESRGAAGVQAGARNAADVSLRST
jgi:hypothetical protein